MSTIRSINFPGIFLDIFLKIVEIIWKNQKIITVFPRIVSAETILFWNFQCGNYSREETIKGRKVFKGGNYYFCTF